jgi:hypothetical protein
VTAPVIVNPSRLFQWVAVLTLIYCAGCNPRGRVEAARVIIENFHDAYNRRDYSAMYHYAGPSVQSTTPQSEFVAYESQLRSKLGDLKSADLVNYNLLYLMSGPQVRMDYNCKYVLGTAVESFEVNFRKNKAQIDAYRIDSPQLDTEKDKKQTH